MIKESIHQESIAIIYVSNMGAPNYVKQTLVELKGKIDSNREDKSELPNVLRCPTDPETLFLVSRIL